MKLIALMSLVVIAVIVAVVGIRRGASAPSTACPATAARVFLFADGKVTLNGSAVAVDALGSELEKMKPPPTEICYSRGAGSGEPPPVMPRVLDAIASLRVPISFYTDASFSQRVSLR